MRNLSDKFVVDQRTVEAHKLEDQRRERETRFEKKCREVEGARVLKDPQSVNPLADKLKGVSV